MDTADSVLLALQQTVEEAEQRLSAQIARAASLADGDAQAMAQNIVGVMQTTLLQAKHNLSFIRALSKLEQAH